MEVIGGVAASAQLLGTVVRILNAIIDIRDYIQNASGRFQKWHAELVALTATVSCIKQSPRLHTANIGQILEGISQKMDQLGSLFTQFSLAPNLGPVKKIFKSFSASAVECRILQSFTALERDKTTLILTINTIYGSILADHFGPTRLDMDPASKSR
jgi:hypothetical protein